MVKFCCHDNCNTIENTIVTPKNVFTVFQALSLRHLLTSDMICSFWKDSTQFYQVWLLNKSFVLQASRTGVSNYKNHHFYIS